MRINIKPSEGLKVFHPSKERFLLKGGEVVNIDHYWKSRIKDGDVVEITTTPQEKKKEIEKNKENKKW